MAEVNLRSWTIADVPAMALIMNCAKMQGNLRDGIPFPYTEADAREFIGMILEAEPGVRYDFAITYADEVVGSISVTPRDNVYRLSGEIGYCLRETHWGQGIMTEAVRQVCGYVFRHTDLIRIAAEVFAPNLASCRVLEKAGFSLEGTLRRSVVKHGQVLDSQLYAILKENWA